MPNLNDSPTQFGRHIHLKLRRAHSNHLGAIATKMLEQYVHGCGLLKLDDQAPKSKPASRGFIGHSKNASHKRPIAILLADSCKIYSQAQASSKKITEVIRNLQI